MSRVAQAFSCCLPRTTPSFTVGIQQRLTRDSKPPPSLLGGILANRVKEQMSG